MSKGEILKRWKAALEDEHPIVIVATGSFLSIPRSDLGLIVVEHESSRGYKTASRPFIDYRFLAERYSREIGADLIYGDSFLRVETIWREEEGPVEGQLVQYAPLAMRSLSSARDSLIDMKKYKKNRTSGEIRIISDELVTMALKAREESGNLFIFGGRKGLAPQTICADCETTVLCTRCSAPLVLHGKKNEHTNEDHRFFLCNRCGLKRDAKTTCATCGSWRLTTLGIGTEKIELELARLVPELKIFRLDRESAPTPKKAAEIADAWHAHPGSALIGTELALSYLDGAVDYCAIGTLDALFSIPDFRINEKIFSLILKMRSITTKQFLIQTRNADAPVLSQGVKGNIIDFYREEIESRKQFGFPPYCTFIKISYSGKKDDVLTAMEQLKVTLAGWQVDVFPAFIATIKNEYLMHALIKLSRKEWPQPELLERLRGLSPSYAVNVDPESIL